jgi:hypothetical protein
VRCPWRSLFLGGSYVRNAPAVLGYPRVTARVDQRSPLPIPGETLNDLQIFVGYLGCYRQLPYGMTAASIYKEDECLHAPEVGRASFQRQILNGIKIRDQYYLRLFPPSSYSAPPLAITALRTNGNVVSKRGPWVVHSELPMIPKRKFLPKPYRGERRVAHPFHNVRQFWFISE